MGPLELIVIAFEGNKFSGEILPEVSKVIDRGIIKIVDFVFAKKAADGTLTIIELTDYESPDMERYAHFFEDLTGLLTEEDVRIVAESLPENSSVALLLFEHTWEIGIKEAVSNAGGEVLVQERIPPETLEMLSAELAAAEQDAV